MVFVIVRTMNAATTTSASPIQKLLTALYVLFAVLVAASTLYFITLCYHLGPFRDMWIAMDFIRAVFESSPPLSDWWALHGGAHRLLVPRLLFVLEYGVFAGSNVFLMLVSVALQFSVVCLVWCALKQEAHINTAWRWLLTAMTLLLMLNATQLENFIYTFDMQWFLTSAAAVWALHFWNQLWRDSAKQVSLLAYVPALLLTFVSLLSSFSGVCVLLVLPVLALAYRLPRNYMVGLCVLLALLVGAYMSGPFAKAGNWAPAGLQVSVSDYLLFLCRTALLWLQWIALYLGSPLGREYAWPAAFFAYGSLGFVCWQWCVALRQGASYFTAFQIFCLAIALFAALVGISTGLGRMYFVHTADEDRYQSIVLVYWLGVFAFALSRSLILQHRYYQCASVALMLFWTLWVIPSAAIKDARAQLNFFDRVNDANLAIATGQWGFDDIKDTLILGDKWQKRSRPEQHAAFLREHHWGVFASAPFALLGSRIDSHGVSADSCEGSVHSISAAAAPYRGYRISGTGQNVIAETPLSDYIALDDSGEVVGIGRLQRQKNSLWPRRWQAGDQDHNRAQWLLYTRDLDAVQSLRILGALDKQGGYCQVAVVQLPARR